MEFLFATVVCGLMAAVSCMMPALQQQQDDFNFRVPPRWNPEQEHQYSFRACTTDMMLWSLLTELHPHQQAAAMVMRLGGSAREVTRTLTTDELMFGGDIEGVHYDPV